MKTTEIKRDWWVPDPKIIRDFDNDLKFSNNIKLREEWKRIIPLGLDSDCEIIFHDSKKVQLGFNLDIVVVTSKGRRFSVELKTRREKYFKKSYIFEIVHHRYSDINMTREYLVISKPGWLYTSTAEYIAFATVDQNKIIELCIFSLLPFKTKEFKSEISPLPIGYSYTSFPNRYQRTLLKIVEREFLQKHANYFNYWIDSNYQPKIMEV